MPTTITNLRAFLASPSDVILERQIVTDVINELNKVWSHSLNLQIELIKWESNTYPNFLDYSQNVINTQIDDNYDIFIGILWSRLGTPTQIAASGTVEEFERAYARFKSGEKLNILMYFKDDPIPPSKIDILQIQKIHDFRSRLADLGGYYWQFTQENFEAQVRQHLSRLAQDWQNEVFPSNKIIVQDKPPINDSVQDEELGLYDLIEIFTDSMTYALDDMHNINQATIDIGKRINLFANELNSLATDNLKDRKKTINQSSIAIKEYSEKLDMIRLSYTNHIDKVVEAFMNYIDLYSDIHNEENSLEFIKILKSFDSMISALPITIHETKEFRNTALAIPRMTVEINKAKKLLTQSLSSLISYFEINLDKFQSIQKNGFKKIDDLNSKNIN